MQSQPARGEIVSEFERKKMLLESLRVYACKAEFVLVLLWKEVGINGQISVAAFGIYCNSVEHKPKILPQNKSFIFLRMYSVKGLQT